VTYAQFLLVFLLLPIVVLAVLLRKRFLRSHGIALALVCLLAFVYTTPWDNYAAYKRLWTFDPQFVLGRRSGSGTCRWKNICFILPRPFLSVSSSWP
jgi:putative membrane protein